jgi:multiple sugar transport system permease protein
MHNSLTYKIIRVAVLVFLALFTLYPLWTLITISLTSSSAVGGTFQWVPKLVSLRAYSQMWKSVPLLHYLVNSLITSSLSALIALPIAVLAAYGLTRYHLFGGKVFLRIILATQVVPGVFFLIPLFLIYVWIQNDLGFSLDDTYAGLIITYLTFALPFSIWMLTGYFDTIPRDVEEAAMVDGAGRLRAFFHTTLRMSLPGLAAVSVFAFMTAWGEVLFASVLTNSHTRTLPIGLQLFENTQSGFALWNELMAAALVVSLPVVVGFLVLQRYFVRGLAAGAVK